MISLTIDGKEVQVARGTMLLEACRNAGADIPTLCYDPDLKLAGSCRMCVVEAKGRRNLLAACVTPAENNMIIETESPDVIESRKVILDLLLARHKLECHVCERDGDCKLQDYCYRYNVKESSLSEELTKSQPKRPLTQSAPWLTGLCWELRMELTPTILSSLTFNSKVQPVPQYVQVVGTFFT